MAEQELVSNLNAVVEKVTQNMDKKTFLDAMPAEADKRLLNSLHDRLVTVMRRKMTETVEEHLAKDNIVSKLECLREIMSKTTQATDHKAWRPPGNVMEALAAVDLKVAERENEELRLVEQHLDSEVEQLEQRLEEAVRRERSNRKELDTREQQMVTLNDKLASGAL